METKINFLPKLEKPKRRKERKNVKSTMVDTYMYQDSVNDIKAVRDKLYSNNEQHDFVENLTEDLFHCLYKTSPDIHHELDVVEENKISHEILTQIINSDNFDALRKNTVSNLFNSTLSLSSVQDKAVSTINDVISKNKKMKELMDKIKEARQTRKKLEAQEDRNGKVDPKTKDKLDKLLNDISNKQQDLQFDLDGMASDLAKGIGETNQMVGDVNNLLDGFGGDEDGQVRKLSYEEKINLASNIKKSKKFKQVCDMVGRMNEMVHKVGKKPSPFGHAVNDIGLGNDISKVLNSEKVNLTDDKLEDVFLKKYTNKGLLEFKTDGRGDGRGPMVICLDESGSMNGDREIWSKAFCVACIQIAHKQKRNCKIITFESQLGEEYEFEKKKLDIRLLAEFCSNFESGGTNFEKPISRAVQTIKSAGKYKKADILFVTDGDPSVRGLVTDESISEIKVLREAIGLNVQSVLIGNNVKQRFVEKFSDTIVRVSNLSEDGVMINVFDNVLK